MAFVYLNAWNLHGGSRIPPELQDVLLPSQWAAICDTVQHCRQEADFWSCCFEMSFFLVTCFPCIFCIHPCCSYCLYSQNLQSKVPLLNQHHFNGERVVSVADGRICIDTTRITTGSLMYPNNAVLTTAHYVQPEYNSIMVSQPTPPAAGSGERLMTIVIPPGAEPGAQLQVVTPEGNTITIHAPKDSYPGKQIIMQY